MRLRTKEKQDQQLREQRRDEAKQVMLLARECLSDEKFKRYKEKAIAHRDKLLKEIFKFRATDPIEYAFELRELLAVADFSLQLLEDVEGEAKMEGGKENS